MHTSWLSEPTSWIIHDDHFLTLIISSSSLCSGIEVTHFKSSNWQTRRIKFPFPGHSWDIFSRYSPSHFPFLFFCSGTLDFKSPTCTRSTLQRRPFVDNSSTWTLSKWKCAPPVETSSYQLEVVSRNWGEAGGGEGERHGSAGVREIFQGGEYCWDCV